jgi:hypothetical protein
VVLVFALGLCVKTELRMGWVFPTWESGYYYLCKRKKWVFAFSILLDGGLAQQKEDKLEIFPSMFIFLSVWPKEKTSPHSILFQFKFPSYQMGENNHPLPIFHHPKITHTK